MEQYINPPAKVKEIGRPVSAYPVTYDNLLRQLRQGEALYAYCDRGVFHISVHIDRPSEFQEFYERQYKQGYLLSVEFFAVPVS